MVGEEQEEERIRHIPEQKAWNGSLRSTMRVQEILRKSIISRSGKEGSISFIQAAVTNYHKLGVLK